MALIAASISVFGQTLYVISGKCNVPLAAGMNNAKYQLFTWDGSEAKVTEEITCDPTGTGGSYYNSTSLAVSDLSDVSNYSSGSSSNRTMQGIKLSGGSQLTVSLGSKTMSRVIVVGRANSGDALSINILGETIETNSKDYFVVDKSEAFSGEIVIDNTTGKEYIFHLYMIEGEGEPDPGDPTPEDPDPVDPPAGDEGKYTTRTITDNGTVSTWTFNTLSSDVSVNADEPVMDNGMLFGATSNGSIKFKRDGYLACKGMSSIGIPVPAGGAGSIALTASSSTNGRWFQLYINGAEGPESQRLWSKYAETADGDKGPQSFEFTSADLTQYTDGNTYLHLVDNDAEMKVASFKVTLTSGAYDGSTEPPVVDPVPVTGVTLNKTTLTLKEGESEKLTATVQPSNADNKNVSWSSSDPAVADVDQNGNVSAIAKGEATITVTTEDQGKTATCKVTVEAQGTDPTPQPTGDAYAFWRFSGSDAPAIGDSESGTKMTVEFLTSDDSKEYKTESAGYNTAVTDENMTSQGSKGLKMGANALYLKVTIDGGFKANDVVSICGYNPWKVSSTEEHAGDIAASVATGTGKADYNVGSFTLSADADALYMMRAEGSGTGICAIKVTRGGDTPPEPEQSHDATLKSLTYGNDETSVPDFSADKLNYEVVLPTDYDGDVPEIQAEVNDEGKATVEITQATSLPGTAKAVVTAEDGTTKTYTVEFSKEGTDPTPQPTGEVCAHWRFSGGDAPGVGAHEDGTNMRVEFLTNDDSKSFSNESAAYNASMTDEDMKSQGSKGVKMVASALYLKVSFFDGIGFKAGDVVTICGYNPWKISSTAEGTGDVAASITTGTSKTDYNIGSYTLTSNHEALFFSRVEGTSTGICAIKVTRGGDTPPEPEKSHDATLKSLTYGNDETSVPGFNADKLNYEVVLPSDYEGGAPSIQAELNDEKATIEYEQATAIPGTAKAVVTAEDGTTTLTYTVKFSKEGEEPQEINVTGVTLNRATLTMNVGATSTLIAQIIPSDATNQNVTWSSSNPSVATVEAGVVTAKTVGSTTITVITEDGGFDATCNVTVKEDTPTPPVPQTDLTIHYPGVYEDVEAKGGYGKELNNGYEVFYAGRWDNGGTKLTIHVTPEDKSKGITKNETNSSYEAIDGWFKGSGTDKGTGFDPKEEFAEATSRCHTMTSSNSLEMHISGYDQFSLYAADKKWEPNKPANCKYFKVSIDDVPQTMEPSTSPTIRRFDITSGEHVIKISLVGDGNLFGGFSLHEAQVPSVKYLKGNDSTQVVLQTEKLPRDIIYFTKYNKLGETRVIWENGEEATGFGLSIKGSTDIGDTLVLSGVANCPVGVYPFHVSSFDENGNETKRLPSGKITVTSDIRATSLTEVEVYEDETMEEIGFSYHALSANDISIDWKGNTPAGIQGYGADGKYYIGGTPTQQGEYPFTISVKGGNSIDGIIKVLPPVSGDNMVLYLYTNGNRETILKKDGIADYISKTMGYTIIPRTANNSGLRSDEDYKKYKWILISEDANADNTEVLALTQQSAILPVLNMKGFAYAEERLSWGDPNNGSLTDNGRYITVQRDDHPIFKGKKLGDKIEVLSKIDEKGLMPIDIHLPGTYCLATSLPRSQTDYHGEDEKHPFTFLHEVPARMRGGKKYICMPIAMSSSKNLTPAGKDLVKAVVNYLLSDDEASIQIPQLQITSFVIDGINGNIDESKNKITFEIDLKEHFGVDKHAIAPTITAASDYTHVFTKLEKDGVVDFSESWSFPVQYEVSDYINRRVYDVAIRFFSSEGIEDVYAVGDWVNIYDIFGRKVSTTNEDIYRMVLPRGVYIIVTETGETFKIMR